MARSLPEDIQIRDARKVEINANVTFIMWLAEWLANLTVMITWFLSPDLQLRLTRTTVVLFWYYVLLPNLYLMNTAHNKDRIIDDGLLSTIKNGLNLPLGLNICFSLPSRWKICENSQEQATNITDVQSATNKNNLEMSTKKLEIHDTAVSTGVYTISKDVSALNPSENLNHISTSDVFENPSTSKESIDGEKRCPIVPFHHKQLSESDQEDENPVSQSKLHLNNLESLLGIMGRNIDNENNYLFYFAQLADYTNRVRETKLADRNFKIVNICKPLRPYDISPSHRKGKSQIKTQVISTERFFHNSTVKYPLIGKFSDRILLRRNFLENFHQYCIDGESYDRYITDLMDLEESFVAP